MAAIGLIYGRLTAEHYTDEIAADPRIDRLRAKMFVRENESFTHDYYDLEKRAIGNSIQVFFNDGSKTDRVEIQYPVGHRHRREEGIPLLKEKFSNSLNDIFEDDQIQAILSTFDDDKSLSELSASQFMDLFVTR